MENKALRILRRIIMNKKEITLPVYYHDVHCNASRQEPMGNYGCSCFMTQRAKRAENNVKEAKFILNQIMEECFFTLKDKPPTINTLHKIRDYLLKLEREQNERYYTRT